MKGKRQVASYRETATTPSRNPRAMIGEYLGNKMPMMIALSMAGSTMHGQLMCKGIRLKVESERLAIGEKPMAKIASLIRISLSSSKLAFILLHTFSRLVYVSTKNSVPMGICRDSKRIVHRPALRDWRQLLCEKDRTRITLSAPGNSLKAFLKSHAFTSSFAQSQLYITGQQSPVYSTVIPTRG
jgi:hypothetical protein